MAVLAVVIAYLLGCIPFGVIVARAYGVDLRGEGSGNIGATNALRVIGRKAGAITLIGDIGKGALAVYIAGTLAGRDAAVLAAAAAVLGHDFPVFMRFKGGKGVATSLGALVVVEPLTGLVCIAAWLLVMLAFRYSSLSALASFGLLPVVALVAHVDDRWFLALSLFLTVLIYVKHKDNIARLIRGQEKSFGRKA